LDRSASVPYDVQSCAKRMMLNLSVYVNLSL